jgi:hypothetical protein
MAVRLMMVLAAMLALHCHEPAVPDSQPVSHTRPLRAADLWGCYSVGTGSWEPAFSKSSAFRVPKRIQLTRESPPPQLPQNDLPTANGGPFDFIMRTFDALSPVRGRWSVDPKGAVTLTWSAPVSVTAFVERDVVGNDLVGIAKPMPPNGSYVQISLHRVPC